MATRKSKARPLAIQTIEAITEIVTGGSASERGPSIGLYRSGPRLTSFFGGLNIDFSVGGGSRVPAVRGLLRELNGDPDRRAQLVAVIEAAADPRDFLDSETKLNDVVEHLNKRLRFDDYELKRRGQRFKLTSVSTGAVAIETLRDALHRLDLESVTQDFDRAIEQAETDPEGAITAACSTVESVCKCILDELASPYPKKQDIRGLVTEVAKHLKLSPSRSDLPADIERDVRQVLGGLATVTGGIGSLRTHGGDAHGRGKHRARVDARIARLAIHAASTVCLFYVETWERLHKLK